MKKVFLLVAALMILLSPAVPVVRGQGIDFGDEEDGMSDEEFREYIYELIQKIIE